MGVAVRAIRAGQYAPGQSAAEVHAAVQQALLSAGFAVAAEVRVADRGDGRSGKVDVVASRRDGGAVGIEIDRLNPREKSIRKLQAVDGGRVVVLRGSWSAPPPVGIDEVVGLGIEVSAEERDAAEPTDAEWPIVERVLGKLTEATGVRFKDRHRNGRPTGYVKFVLRRLREDVTEEELRKVIRHRATLWRGTDQEKYLTPETLFGREKFDTYLAQAIAAYEQPARAGPSANEPVSHVVQDVLRGQR